MASKLAQLLAELKRRKVYQVAAAYVVVGLGILGAAELVLDPLGLGGLRTAAVVLVLVGFPVALVLAWAYELRPEESHPVESGPNEGAPPSKVDGRKSIVVLPFDNMSPDPGDAYFADGLTEEIITDLSQVRSLRVISRSSAMAFKGTRKDVRTIGGELDVQYVLEGSVRKAGDDLRMTAQLIDATSDAHLWAETYDGTMEDVFRIQEQTARAIVDALRLSLTPEEEHRLAERPIDDVQAYQCYLKARSEFWSTEPGSQEKALRLLEEAVSVVGEHALLVSGIGAVHWQFYHQLGDQDERHLLKIEECAEKLFAEDPGSPYGHRLVGYLRLNAGKTDEAAAHLYEAWKGDPDDVETVLWLSYLLAFQAGHPAISRPVVETWIGKDPLDPMCRSGTIMLHWMSGDTGLALEAVDEGLRVDPHNRTLRFHRGHLLAWHGQTDESLRQAEILFEEDPNEAMGQALRFLTLSLKGKEEDALNTVTPEVGEWIRRDFHLPWLMAEGYAVLGRSDEALRWVARTIEAGVFNYPLLSELDPFLDGVRSEDRFKALMVGVREEWEAFGRDLHPIP